MSLYYLHIRRGCTLIRDEEVMECHDLKEALAEAEASARDAVRATLYSADTELTSIEIADEDGEALGEVSYAISHH